MAYKWSWAFGPETALELNDLAGWVFGSTNPSQFSSSQDIVHTYAGDAADRWALQMDYTSGGARTPLQTGAGKGWAACYFYFNDPADDFEVRNLMEISGPNSSDRSIDIRGQSGNNFDIYIDSNLISTSSLGLAKDTWHHVAVKYDMTIGTPSAGTWGAELFINGVSVSSGSRTSSNLNQETGIHVYFNGLEIAGKYTMLSDIVFYDELTDPCPYGQLVTRTGPTTDVSDSGSWSPASGPGNLQSTNLAGKISTTPVVSEAIPLTGEFVRVGTDILGTTLGLSSFDTYGVTAHLYASGSSTTNIIAGIGQDSPIIPLVTGSSVVDGENAYTWASATISSGTTASGSSFILNAEISGS